VRPRFPLDGKSGATGGGLPPGGERVGQCRRPRNRPQNVEPHDRRQFEARADSEQLDLSQGPEARGVRAGRPPVPAAAASATPGLPHFGYLCW
jgi:hypothetical protein